jgi:hypothetical protein
MAITKEEVVKQASVLEEENKVLKEKLLELQTIKREYEAAVKLREEAVNREFELRKERDQLKKINEDGQKLNNALKTELTNLANLFDEYINAYKDQVKMLGVFVKNSVNIEAFLQTKIDTFNKANEPKKEK